MNEKELVQSVDRALSILEVVADHESIGIKEISQELNLNKATIHRLLSTLIYKGFVEQLPNSNKYRSTFKLFQLGNKRIQDIDILKVARPYISQLANEVNETIHLVVEDANEVVYIDKIEPKHSVFIMHSRIGKRNPMYCTAVGKAILSHYPDIKIKQIWDSSKIIKITENTITDFDQFMQEINKIRTLGYAMDEQENEIGVRCVAATIFDHERKVAGAISLSAPTIRFDEEYLDIYPKKIQEYSNIISKELGY